jgi:hypothetical protein
MNMLNIAEEYNLATNTWRTVASMSELRCVHGVAVVNDKIYAVGGACDAKYLKFVEEFTPPTYIPSATNLTVTTDKSIVNLSWDTVSDANCYNVKRATSQSGPYTTITTSTAITYADTSAVAGNTYYYIVTASNEGGEGGASNEVVVTIPVPSVSLEVLSVSKAKLGDEITVSIIIHDAKNICAEDIQLAYDKDKLELISAEGANGIKIYKESSLSEGIIRYITASLGKTNAANGDKILINLKFKAKALGGAKIDMTNGRIADNSILEEDVKQENCGEKTIFIEPLVLKPESNTLLALGIAAWYYGETAPNADISKYDVDIDSNGIIEDDDLMEIATKVLSNASYSPMP